MWRNVSAKTIHLRSAISGRISPGVYLAVNTGERLHVRSRERPPGNDPFVLARGVYCGSRQVESRQSLGPSPGSMYYIIKVDRAWASKHGPSYAICKCSLA